MDLSLITKSTGLKRYLASGLSVIIGFLTGIPGAESFLPVLTNVAGVLGVAGTVHAAGSRTISKAWLASAAAFIAFIITLAQFIPELQPYTPMLEKLAAFLGAAAGGAVLTAASIKAKDAINNE